MSQGEDIPLEAAQRIAAAFLNQFAGHCQRIEIAGSIRRHKPEVHDIEIVAAPLLRQELAGLWGDVTDRDLLQEAIDAALTDGTLALREVAVHRADGTVETSRRNGASYKALVYQGMPVDLFIVRPPAEWGVIFAIRTGPGDWNEKIVTDCQRYFRRVQGGQVLHLGQPMPCPEEADFFNAVGQGWVEPEYRTLSRVLIQRPGR